MTVAAPTTSSALGVDDFRDTAERIVAEVGKVIVGQADVIRHVLICIIAGRHALLEGVPGLGKTMLIRTLADVLDLKFSRIQFTPDLMPADITGTDIMQETEAGGRQFVFQPGPVFANLILADEINRATPKTQSALLEAMQEKTVTAANRTYRLEAPFFVLATQNPLEMEGTYPLPEAQLDRFLFKVDVPLPQRGGADYHPGSHDRRRDAHAAKGRRRRAHHRYGQSGAPDADCHARQRLCGAAGGGDSPGQPDGAGDGPALCALRLQPAWGAGADPGRQDHGAAQRAL